MEILRTVAETRAWRSRMGAEGRMVGFVPTMGAFHEGHLSLIRRAREECGAVIVSLFVNPTQFGPGEDFERYPRDFDRDRELAVGEGADAMFFPEPDEMYPPGWETKVTPGALASGLCGPFRPGHFEGVATVVCKLFNIVGPDRAYFGEKDFQQLRVVQRMVADLNLPVEVAGCPTVREPDGLAMSSRNRYLSPEEREAALGLSRALAKARELVAGGERSAAAIERAAEETISAHPLVRTVEYAHVVDSETLRRLERFEGEARLILAARVGATRLIDNGALNP